MKHTFRTLALAALIACSSIAATAQEVNTTAMLEIAPYRHIINPAYEPITDGYVYIPILSHIYLYGGQNSLRMRDLIFNQDGKTMWVFNPQSNRDIMSSLRQNTLVRANTSAALLGFGFRLKNDGYLHVNLDANLDAGATLPRDLFEFALGGGMYDLNGTNTFDLTSLGLSAQAYLSLGVGYSQQVNEKWTWGLKVKLLDGIAYAGMRNKDLSLEASQDQWALKGNGFMRLAGPFGVMPASAEYADLESWVNSDSLLPTDWKKYLKPSGFGMAFDLGFTFQPIKQLKISASVTDVGAIYWMGGKKYNYTVDGTFDGVGEIVYSDYTDEDGNFDSQALGDTIGQRMKSVYENAFHSDGEATNGFLAPLTMKLNVGLDAYFCRDIIGLGLYSRTMLYNTRLYEEVTLGAAVRPCTWFNFGLTTSFLDGKWSNVGAGIGLRGGPIALTLAADYVPLTYAAYKPEEDGKTYGIPYRTRGLNLELGLNIVWGWKGNKDTDKDGVWDKLDMCPNTPANVKVDELGCPIDEDGDGVPDYLDYCPGTPAAAYGLTDENGCPTDTDGDGVPDYLDECPGTKPEVYGHVDEKGCALDTDGDGVEDWKDKCPGTPAEAKGHVDENGCELDSDGDGVPDWKDECQNTPAEAYGMIDDKGCPIDTDGDSVPDYKDACPDTPKEAVGYVDANGCELDSDGDGVPDWKDKCPEVAGPKDNKGCPEMKRSITNIFKKAMQGIQFETGKAVIKKSSNGILNQVAQVFLDNPTYYAEVQGHTDNVGKAEMNKKLSQARAEAVRNYLIGKGVAANRLTAVGYGQDKPIADNKTAKGRTLNRRVEFEIEYKETTEEVIKQYADPVPADSIAPATADSTATK